MKLLSLPEMSLTGAVLIAAVLLLRAAFLNRLPKRTFSTLWGLAILRLLLPFSIASAVSLYALLPAPEALPTPEPAPIVTTAEPTRPAVNVSPTFVPAAAISPIAEPSDLPETVPATVPEVEPKPIPTEGPITEFSLETVLFWVWCSGAALLLLVFAAVYLRGRREFRMSLPIESDFIAAWQNACPLRRRVTVRRSDRISAPLTYGVLRPVILLPDPVGTDEKTLEHILTHELVHIRRFDAVKKPLCALAVCLHWFNPLVWIMFFFFTRDLELACDEGAVLQLGIGDRSDYAKTLIGMEARKSGFLPFFSHFAGFAAEERIKAIMKLKKTSMITSIAAALLVCGTAGAFLTSAAAKPEEEAALTDREKAVKEMEEYQKRIEDLIAEAQNTETTEEERIAKNYASRIDVLKNDENDLHARYRETAEQQAALEEEIQQIEARLAEYQQTLAAAREDGSSDPHDVQEIAEECERLEKEKNDLLAEQQETAERRATLEKRIEQTEALLAEYEAALQEISTEWEWWTAEEYEKWIEEQEKEMESLIGTGSGWYDKEGNFHTFTRESADEILATYRATLEQIKKGIKVSKPSDDGAVLMQSIPKDEEQALSRDELEKALKPYLPFGITVRYDEKSRETKMVYREKEVRALYDETAGLFISNHAGLWDYGEDALDLYAVYTDGVLTGVREATEAEQAENTAVRRANTQAWLMEGTDVIQAVEITQTDLTEAYVETPEQQKARIDGLFAEYARFGLTRDERGKVTFHGRPVRIFMDGVDHLDDVAMITRYTYLDEEGEIDVRTVWAPKDNGDGSFDPFGTMLGIEETTSLNLNDFRAFESGAVTEQTSIDDVIPKEAGTGSGTDAIPSVSVVEGDSITFTEGNSTGGLTIPDVFEKYAPFGITYDKAEGNVYLDGKLVRTFVDSSGHGIFTYRSRSVGGRETIDVRTVYENGRIVSVREMTEADKNGILTEQPAHNTIYKLKELDSPDISEALAKQPAAPLKEQYLSNLETYEGLGNKLYFIVPGGEEVYSVADGTVVFSDYTHGFGLTVVVRSADGTCWGYCHLNLDLPMASVGESVKAGDVIGYVGSTGWVTGNALHLFLADGTVFESGTASFSAIPTESPLRGSYFMSEDFGQISETLFHNGIDLTGTGITGANIYAFADGTVVDAGSDPSNGNFLRIDHGNGLQSFYAHCKVLYVGAGETVGKGTVIAAVGSSGYATGPHLHFELRKDGTPIDPKPYLNETTANP